ncbi:MAG TPA: LacI family DNA-binding transcriptional regulator [Roseiarcus sp.]|nr:LacI family DNA-binding transcriptional regulator [Roseiarcus sp.]
MSRKAPTIHDVALRAGVSAATASNVFNRNRPVGEESRARVAKAAADLGYRPNHLAAALRAKRSRLIGVVVPEISNPFFASLVHGIEEQAADSPYELVLVSSSEDEATEARRIEALIDRQIEGLIVVPSSDGSFAALREKRGGALPPAVLVDRGCGSPGVDTVGAENAAGGVAATRHLLSLGHRDIAVLTPSISLANIRGRIDGYRQALEEAGLAPRARICVGGQQLDQLRGAIEQDLHRADRPTAIFALTNVAALAAIKAVRALGLDIPGDVSVVGFDDFDWMCALRPYLTTIAQPVDEIVSSAWRLLMQRLSGAAKEEDVRIELPCALKVRESTGLACPRLKVAAGA